MLAFLLTISDEINHPKIMHLYNTYHKDMIKFARSVFFEKRKINYIIDAEDAVHSALYKISKNIDKIDFSRSEQDIRNYIFTILINEIVEILETFEKNDIKTSKYRKQFREEYCDFVEELKIKERYNEVLAAMDRLDEIYSSTLYLAYVEEKTPAEISKLMGISINTVYTRIARGKQKLLESMKGE